MKKNSLLRQEVEKYLQVPFLMIVLLLIMNGIVYGIDITCGIVVSVFVLIYLIIVSALYVKRKPNIMSDLVAFSFAHGSVQNELIKELTVPYALVNIKGRVLWNNQAFYDAAKSDKQHMRKHIQHIFTDITLGGMRNFVMFCAGASSVITLRKYLNKLKSQDTQTPSPS